MKRICVQELDVLVPCSLVSRDYDETRGKVGAVLHLLAWRAPSCVNLQYLHGCGVREGRRGEEREREREEKEGERKKQTKRKR